MLKKNAVKNKKKTTGNGLLASWLLLLGTLAILGLVSLGLWLRPVFAYANAPVDAVAEEESFVEENTTTTEAEPSTTSPNPYKGKNTVAFYIGDKFAYFTGDAYSDGYFLAVEKNSEESIPVPLVESREPYIFVGWSTGGVPETPIWDVNTPDVTIDWTDSSGNTAILYALYADEEGNGYCTCGQYKEGVYKDSLASFKEAYNNYYWSHFGQYQVLKWIGIIAGFAVLIFLIVGLIWFTKKSNSPQNLEPVQKQLVEETTVIEEIKSANIHATSPDVIEETKDKDKDRTQETTKAEEKEEEK